MGAELPLNEIHPKYVPEAPVRSKCIVVARVKEELHRDGVSRAGMAGIKPSRCKLALLSRALWILRPAWWSRSEQ